MTTATARLQYGNPSADALHWLNQSSFLDHLFTDFTESEKFPPSYSDAVKTELKTVSEYAQNLVKDPLLFQRYRLYDRSLIQYISGFTFENDEQRTDDYTTIVKDLLSDILPLVFKLKMHFQRPRPFQLALANEIQLNPIASLTAHSPAFPSMHACMGYVLFQVCGNRFPETYQHFKDLSEDLYLSRQHLGVCLPSDGDAGRRLAIKITENQEFKIKYRL